MTEARRTGARWAALALSVSGLLTVLGSFWTWGSCPSTPCGGIFMAISEYSAFDLGFGPVTSLAGLMLTAIGLSNLRPEGVSRLPQRPPCLRS
jgi:hypothetical protein